MAISVTDGKPSALLIKLNPVASVSVWVVFVSGYLRNKL